MQERITTSHANLIARLPQEHQAAAYENCWRKDWKDEEAHLLPAKHLSAWIQANLYLNLAEAPFDREDALLKPEAGTCVTCPRRSGHNTSLFHDVQGDQCLDAPCYQAKVTAHIDRQLAARPGLVTIETAWRSPTERHPGALQVNQTRELAPENPDAEPPCASAKAAIIVFGKHAGRTVTVCLDAECSVHHPQAVTQRPEDLPPVMEPAPEEETNEEAAQSQAEHEQRMADYETEQKRKEEERKAEWDRQQQEYAVEQARREKQRKARLATFERIITQAPVTFSAAQLRVFLRLLVHLDYSFLEDVAAHFVNGDENTQQTDEEIVLHALDGTADEQLTGLALRMVLSDHIGIPHDGEPDFLSDADQVFASKKLRGGSVTRPASKKAKAPAAKHSTKKGSASKKAA